MSCIIFMTWPMPTSQKKDSYVVHAFTSRTSRSTLYLGLFTTTWLVWVSCLIILVWTKHGEREFIMEDDEEDHDDNNLPNWAIGAPSANTTMGEAEEEVAEDSRTDDLGQVLRDAQKDAVTVPLMLVS